MTRGDQPLNETERGLLINLYREMSSGEVGKVPWAWRIPEMRRAVAEFEAMTETRKEDLRRNFAESVWQQPPEALEQVCYEHTRGKHREMMSEDCPICVEDM